MFHNQSPFSRLFPIARPARDAAQPAFHWHCHLPLTVAEATAQARLEVIFRCEISHGPIVQGAALQTVTLPPGGTTQVLLRDPQTRLILDAGDIRPQHCEVVPAETIFLLRWHDELQHLGLRQTNHAAEPIDNLHIAGTPVALPFLVPVLHSLIDRTETASRTSETAARTARSAAVRDGGPADLPRLLHNSSTRRALALFFYQAEKIELARLELYRIDRVVDAPTAAIAAEVSAEIDRSLIGLDLIDSQQQITAAARATFSWERTFRLPTPHLLVKACPIDIDLTDRVMPVAALDLRPYPRHAA